MVFTFFIYGLSFFILGMAIYIYPRTNTQLKLAGDLWLLSLFGVTHGVNEWLDMFILITPEHEAALRVIRMLILPGSFFFLVQFGINAIVRIKNGNAALKVIPLVLVAVWIIITGISSQRFLIGSISARYLLCIPGTLLTAYALILYLPDCNRIEHPGHLNHMVKLAAVSFLLYGFFSGVIVPDAWFFPASVVNYTAFSERSGMPVQLLRTLCALSMAYAVTRILGIFEWETIDSLRKANDNLEEMVRRRTASLQAINSELRDALEKAKKI